MNFWASPTVLPSNCSDCERKHFASWKPKVLPIVSPNFFIRVLHTYVYNSSPKMCLLLKWVQVEAMSTPWWCMWPSRQTGKAGQRGPGLFTGLRGLIDAHSGAVYSKGSRKRIEFLGSFCCTIIWPVCFIKTKIVIQSNSSGLASIAQNRIFTSWQNSLRRGLLKQKLFFFFWGSNPKPCTW